VRWKFYLQSVWGKTCNFKHRKYQNLWINNKGGVDENAICLHFLPYILNICRKLEFLISQGIVATCLKRSGRCRMGFVANFICFLAVQKFWQSVNIWQSYREFNGGNFFWDTVYVKYKTWWGWNAVKKATETHLYSITRGKQIKGTSGCSVDVTWKVELRQRLTATYHQRSRAESNVFSALHVTWPPFSWHPDQ